LNNPLELYTFQPQPQPEGFLTPESKPQITVVLAQFDDATFIYEQIQSIESQEGVNVHLLICSDGGIEPDYSELFCANERSVITKAEVRRNTRNLGFAKNFLVNAKSAPKSEFYAFSDQDDIWLSTKLERAINKIKLHPQNLPILYCARTQITDASAQEDLGFSPKFTKTPSFRNALVQNIGGGNTMVMNQAAWNLVTKLDQSDSVISHDWWSYQIVSGAGGIVIYDDVPSMKYRQHNKNIVGANNNWRARGHRIESLFQGRFKDWNEVNLQALKANESLLTETNKRVMQDFAVARNSGLFKRLFLFWRSGVYRQTVLGNLGLIFGILVNRV